MISAIFLWKIPSHVPEAEFEKWYYTKHVKELREVKELRGYVVGKIKSEPAIVEAHQRAAVFTFDSVEDMDKAMNSPEWQAAAADAGGWISDPIRLVVDAVQILP